MNTIFDECIGYGYKFGICVLQTSSSRLLFYSITVDEKVREVYVQDDSPTPGLRRDSAELYTKEKIPLLVMEQVLRIMIRK